VNTYTTDYQAFPAVAIDAMGNFAVVWESYTQDGSYLGTFGQRFDASGAPRGGEFQVNTFTTSTQYSARVASDPAGNFVVAWSSSSGQDGSGFGVFGQRFGGLLPSALSVDATASASSDGNRVLEAGETVTVAPSWRNLNGAAQTFAGGASSFDGPAGAVYTLVDATANYGTVADGSTASCMSSGDCYSLEVFAPALRPARHWDAAVREDISPDVQGQTRNWALHVGESFADVPKSNIFYRFVETLLHHGVTAGCSATEYCPQSATTRAQMAVFALVAKEGAGFSPPACVSGSEVFADLPASSPFCRWVEELARRGVVAGCGGGNYCPNDPVTRGQMGVFIGATFGLTLYGP
jgi:hypothetical protein